MYVDAMPSHSIMALRVILRIKITEVMIHGCRKGQALIIRH